MNGTTHKEGGMLVGIAGFLLLREQGLLLPDVNEVLQLAVIYPFAMWGSTVSDLDHHWESAPTKDGFSWAINRILHLTTKARDVADNVRGVNKTAGYHLMGIFDAKHRSWQTHSDLTLASIILLLWAVLTEKFSLWLSAVDTSILSLILVGISLGIIAHFILDMITPDGIHLVSMKIINKFISLVFRREVKLFPEKLSLVPKWDMFTVGSGWETLVRSILKVAKVVLVVYVFIIVFCPNIMDTIFPYEIKFEY